MVTDIFSRKYDCVSALLHIFALIQCPIDNLSIYSAQREWHAYGKKRSFKSLIRPKENTNSSHRNLALHLFSDFEYQLPALCFSLTLGCLEQRQTRQPVNAECSWILGTDTILAYCFAFMSRSFVKSKFKTNPILYIDMSPDAISFIVLFCNSISFSCFWVTLVSVRWVFSLRVGYGVKIVAQNMGIFHLPVFLNENQLYNYCRIVWVQSVSHFHSCLIPANNVLSV